MPQPAPADSPAVGEAPGEARGEQRGEAAITAPKLASVVARRLEDEVVRLGWPVGEVLGSESELLDRFGVSRAVLREAVRIVEHTGAAHMRRGPGGGLVVSQPDRTAVVTAMGVWFGSVGVTISEMLEARAPLVLASCRLAAKRVTVAGAGTLQGVLDGISPRQVASGGLSILESEIARLAGNPTVALFVDSLADLGVRRLETGRARVSPRLGAGEAAAHLEGYRRLVAAIEAGDAAGAERIAGRLVEAVQSRLLEGPPTAGPGVGRPAPGRLEGSIGRAGAGEKLAERVAGEIREEIERAGWPVGTVLGSEVDLIERYGVSRAILREAVRILEHHGVVRTKRGPGGGFITAAPDASAIVRSARILLEYEGVTPAGLLEGREVVEAAAARLAARRRTREAIAHLGDLIEREARTREAAASFISLHRAIAAATGNRLLGLFADVMGELVPGHLRWAEGSSDGVAELSGEVHRAHRRIVEAIAAGDPDLAERRMVRHLRASIDVLE